MAYEIATSQHELLFARRPVLIMNAVFCLSWGMGILGNRKLLTRNVVVVPPVMIIVLNMFMLYVR